MNLHALKYAIEELYSIRFINDTNTVNNNPNEDVEPVPFPTFVFEFLTNKFTKKPMVDQHSLDLLLSVDFYPRLMVSVGKKHGMLLRNSSEKCYHIIGALRVLSREQITRHYHKLRLLLLYHLVEPLKRYAVDIVVQVA